jgi:VCBS repeat-containing protein
MTISYYLAIDGIVGDSLSDAAKGAFTVVDYSFDASAVVNAMTGAGNTAATPPTFSPLTVDLSPSPGLTTLLTDLASGADIPSIELKGVTSDGQTVYDLKLGEVTVTTYHDTNSGLDKLAFSYQQVSLTTTPQKPDGTLGTPTSFSYDITTDKLGVNIPDPNLAPIAIDDAVDATAGVGGTATGNVLANDSDPDGDPLSVTPFVGTGAHGTLTLNADGSFSYTVADLNGPTGSHLHDVFAYTESDGRGGTASAHLDITLDRAPIAVGDAVDATTGIGGTATGNVLANDSDPDGDPLSVTPPLVSTGAHGTLTLSADGSFSYTVTDLTGPTGSHLHDVFAYTETDGHGGTASAQLDITLNRAPIVLDNIAGVKVGATSSGNVLGNDADPDGDQLSVTAMSGGSVGQAVNGVYGTLVLNSDGSYSYTATHGAASGQTAIDVFHFSESDGHGGTVQSTLSLTIVPNGQTYLAGTPGGTLAAANGKGVLDGSLGTQHLSGGNGADVLIGGNGDVLTGGNGPDQFVFTGNFGRNEVTDFTHNDTLQLDKSTFVNVNDILAHYASDDGHGNTVIADPHNPSNMIVLDHLAANQLRPSDFVLV